MRRSCLHLNLSPACERQRALIESIGKTDAFLNEGTLCRIQPGTFQLPPGMQLPPQLQAQVQVALHWDSEGWKVVR